MTGVKSEERKNVLYASKIAHMNVECRSSANVKGSYLFLVNIKDMAIRLFSLRISVWHCPR